jgi:hypothetical protein
MFVYITTLSFLNLRIFLIKIIYTNVDTKRFLFLENNYFIFLFFIIMLF